MDTSYNYATWVVLGICLVAALIYMFNAKGEFENNRSKTKT